MTDELQLILETLSQAGPHAKSIFIMWLLAEKIFPGLVFLTTIATVALLARPYLRAALTHTYATAAMKEIRDLLGIGIPGHLTQNEIMKVVEKIKRSVADTD